MAVCESRLLLSGPLTVAVCEAVQAQLAAALQEDGDLVVEVDAQADTDLSFLQLLIAAHKTARASGKRIALAAPPEGEFATALAACGYAPRPDVVALSEIFAPQGGRN